MQNYKIRHITTQKLIELVEEKLKNKPLIYISKDLERGIGLANLVKNYFNISVQRSVLHDYLKQNIQSKFDFSLIAQSTYSLLKSDFTTRIIKKYKSNLLFRFFQQSLEEEKYLDELGIKFLNNRLSLSKKFEDKTSLTKVLKDTKIKAPKSYQIDFSMSEHDCELLLHAYFKSGKFVIQKDRSHTGNASYLCDMNDWILAYNSLKGEQVKVSEYIEGVTLTINGCLVQDKCYFSAPQVQITGIDYLTPGKLSTVGNDFTLARLYLKNHSESSKLFEFCHEIGQILKKEGFRGLFGLDILYDGTSFYLIEINARQTANISLQTHLELISDITPLELIDLCQWLDVKLKYVQSELYFIDGSQIFLRSSQNLRIIDNQIKPGFYRLRSDRVTFEKQNSKEDYKNEIDVIYLDEDRDRPVVFHKKGFCLIDGGKNDHLLFMPKFRLTVCNKFDELFRIQSKLSLCDSHKKLKVWVKDLLLAVNELI